MPASSEFVERCQLELQRNPRSRIFAPLAEAYRQMGLYEEALQICTRGVQFNPDFAGGRVAYAKILLARQETDSAVVQLEKAVALSPDNILAQSLLGDTLLTLRRPKEALNAFKMVLVNSPTDAKSLAAVKKWEFLLAEDYDDEMFSADPEFAPDKKGVNTQKPSPTLEPLAAAPTSRTALASRREREIERAVSLADAFTVRGEFERAHRLLLKAREILGQDKEIDKRLSLLQKRTGLPVNSSAVNSLAPLSIENELPSEESRERKVEMLETFLQRISERRKS